MNFEGTIAHDFCALGRSYSRDVTYEEEFGRFPVRNKASGLLISMEDFPVSAHEFSICKILQIFQINILIFIIGNIMDTLIY